MLGMLINTSLPWAPNAWKAWVDHIMRQKTVFDIKEAALLHENGSTASATRGFTLRASEMQQVEKYCTGDGNDDQTIRLQGKTCIVKSSTKNQVIAFRGNKYYIISKSKTMFIAALCESKTKVDDAANYIRKLNTKLMDKDF